MLLDFFAKFLKKKEKKMCEPKRGDFVLMVRDDGEERWEFCDMTKSLCVDTGVRILEQIDDYDEARALAEKATQTHDIVYLVRLAGCFKKEVKDQLKNC